MLGVSNDKEMQEYRRYIGEVLISFNYFCMC